MSTRRAPAAPGELVAAIDEPRCIGCTLCIQACPVDAIIGAKGQMHTVVTELCTGCELCAPPCPVECIAMVPATGGDAIWDDARVAAARERSERRRARLARERIERVAARATAKAKRDAVQAALARARARRAAHVDRTRAKR